MHEACAVYFVCCLITYGSGQGGHRGVGGVRLPWMEADLGGTLLDSGQMAVVGLRRSVLGPGLLLAHNKAVTCGSKKKRMFMLKLWVFRTKTSQPFCHQMERHRS